MIYGESYPPYEKADYAIDNRGKKITVGCSVVYLQFGVDFDKSSMSIKLSPKMIVGVVTAIEYAPHTGFAEVGNNMRVTIDNGNKVITGDSENGFYDDIYSLA